MSDPISNLLLPHIVDMAPYTPIEPFEVFSARLGRNPEQIVKLDANQNRVPPAPGRAPPWRPTHSRTSTPTRSSACCAWPGRVHRRARGQHLSRPRRRRVDRPALPRLPRAGGRDHQLPRRPSECTNSTWAGRGRVVIEVRRRDDFRVDVERISEWQMGKYTNRRILNRIRNTQYAIRNTQHAPKLLFLTSPNNPDGSLLAPDDLRRLLDLPLIVVLDEAYIEFAGWSGRLRPGDGAREPDRPAHLQQVGGDRRAAAGVRHLPELADAGAVEGQTAV